MKSAVLLMLTGAFVGLVAASFIVPPLLGWYTAPGGLPAGAQIQAMVQIPEVIRYATTRLLQGQAIGAGLGAALGLVVYFMTSRQGTNTGPAPATPPSV
jgi:hypothetical protein